MTQLTDRYAAHIAGVFSCYDHLVIRDTLGYAVDPIT